MSECRDWDNAVVGRALEERLHAGPGEWVPLEEFATLPHCLEWRLARRYWEGHGPSAFFTGDVPYASINDGRLSADAVRLLTEIHADAAPATVRVLEVGGGSGLFAKLFLDELRILAPELYAVTTYVWTDATPAMVRSAQGDGLFAGHEDHVLLRELVVPGMAGLGADADAGFDLVVANYLLDNLPATLLRVSSGGLEELEVRTTLDANLDPVHLGGRSAHAWAARVAESDVSDAELAELYPWFSLECRYRPVSRAGFAYGSLITAGADDGFTHWHHHEAAWRWLGEVLPRLRPKGGVLINDYGHSPLQRQVAPTAVQHFGGSLANGLNLDELAAWPRCAPDWHLVAPETDGRHLLSRWISRRNEPLSASLFQLIFDGVRRERVPELLDQARDRAAEGRTEEARWLFWEAYQRSPRCWHLLERWATFYLAHLKDAATARELAEAALRLHSRHPPLWNVLGDALYEMEQFAEAEKCYRQAVELNPREIRARLNLAYVHLRTGRLAEALAVLAEALARDTQADYRDALLEKQRQILQQLSANTHSALTQQLNRFRNLDLAC